MERHYPYPMRRLLPCAVLLLAILIPSSAQAWSFKEHILVTRLAVQRLLADEQTPQEMKAWLQKNAPKTGDEAAAKQLLIEQYIGPQPEGLIGLDYWTIFPDITRQVDGNKPVEPFGAPEALMHYLDLEFFVPGEGPKVYKHDLSNKPDLEDLPRDRRDPRLVQAGYLPWRVEQVYGKLVTAIRQGRLEPTGVDDRDNALVLAGYLAHYLADNTQPQHATIDYRSAAYFSDARSAPNVHGMFEYGMVDWDKQAFPELREELWTKLNEQLDARPAIRQPLDPWRSTVRISAASYDALPLIGIAAQKAAGQAVMEGDPTRPEGRPARGNDEFDVEAFFRTRGTVNGQEMTLLDLKARQLAIATLRIESMLRQAWMEAQQAPAAQPATRPATRQGR